MRQVIARQVCERHPGDVAAWTEALIIFYPPTGKWYAVDPCEGDADDIRKVLEPFTDIAKAYNECPPRVGEAKMRVSTPDGRGTHYAPPMYLLPREFEMPAGYRWESARNSEGKPRTHLTRDGVNSACSYVKLGSTTQFFGSLIEGAPFCRKCVDRGMPAKEK